MEQRELQCRRLQRHLIPRADLLDRGDTGKHFLAGLLTHAKGLCALATPTINGYKRFRPYSLAPDRIHWGRDNRGAMLRVIGSPGATDARIENRIGEPAANDAR